MYSKDIVEEFREWWYIEANEKLKRSTSWKANIILNVELMFD